VFTARRHHHHIFAAGAPSDGVNLVNKNHAQVLFTACF